MAFWSYYARGKKRKISKKIKNKVVTIYITKTEAEPT